MENVVSPFNAAHLNKGGGYELCMGKEAYTTDRGKRIDLTDEKEVEIPPGHFALLLTQERVKIPADSLGFISVKFTLKAKGLINVSGFHVDPGFDGWLTFSVFNAGPRTITISRNKPSFLLWLAYWDEPITANHQYPSGVVGAKGAQESLEDGMIDNLKGEFCSPIALKNEFEAFKAKHDRVFHVRARWRDVIVFLLGVVVAWAVPKGLDFLSSGKNDGAQQNNGVPTSPPSTAAPENSVPAPRQALQHSKSLDTTTPPANPASHASPTSP